MGLVQPLSLSQRLKELEKKRRVLGVLRNSGVRAFPQLSTMVHVLQKDQIAAVEDLVYGMNTSEIVSNLKNLASLV